MCLQRKSLSYKTFLYKLAIMADPISIIAGIVSISGAAMQSSTAFLNVMREMRSTFDEIRSVSRDVHAFYTIVLSLSAALEEGNVRDMISDDENIIEMIGNLAAPLNNCQIVLSKLLVKVTRQLKPAAKGSRSLSRDMKWILFTKNEVRDLQQRLEATKSTLGSALSAIST